MIIYQPICLWRHNVYYLFVMEYTSNNLRIVTCCVTFRWIKITYLMLALYLCESSLYIAFLLFFCRSRSLFVTNAAKHILRKAHWRDMLMMCTCELKTTSVQFADKSLHNDRLCYNMSRCIKKHRTVDVQHISVHKKRYGLCLCFNVVNKNIHSVKTSILKHGQCVHQ